MASFQDPDDKKGEEEADGEAGGNTGSGFSPKHKPDVLTSHPVKMPSEKEKEDDSGEGGNAAGKIEFRIYVDDTRDDLKLPLRHAEAHLERARRARERIKRLEALREKSAEAGLRQEGQGLGRGEDVSPHKAHPISETAYFSGKQEELPLPSEGEQQDANPENRQELQNRPANQLTYQPKPGQRPAPGYTPPTPSPFK